MNKRDLEIKKMRERIAKRKASESERRKLLIENLSKQIFCEILDGLPLDFKFKLTNIFKDFDGYWEKTIFEDKAAWHQDGRFLFSSSFYEFRDKVFDEIDKEKNIYYKVKRNWQRLTPKLINDKITQFITGKKGEITKTLTKEKLEELYYEQKKSLEDIGKEYACSRVQVMKIMKKCGLIRRRRSKARVEAIKKGKFEKFEYYDINDNFFSEWSPQMAWVLGLLFTDGCITQNRVSINSVDIELLEKIKKLLNSSRSIQKRTQSYDKSKHIYAFEFVREKMTEDLKKLGLHQRKSLNIIFPNVPEEYMRHFIRGCWDGDGSIYIERGSGKVRGDYVCGSLKFIERLVQELYKAGIYKRKPPSDRIDANKMWLKYPDGRFPLKIHKKKRSKSYYIKIDSRESLEKLFQYFYDDVDESIYLTRKFKVFMEGLKLEGKVETD